jgi:hypothetical protein
MFNTGSLKIQITNVAAADYWGRATLRVEQLDDNNVEPILLEMAVGEGPKCKEITECSSTYNRY